MTKRMIDISGQVFGRLTVVSVSPDKRANSNRYWQCLCLCGKTTTARGTDLRRGRTQSCGCLHIDSVSKHGQSSWPKRSSEYAAWCSMKSRCLNSNSQHWKDYGGRGITVCGRWKDSFENFLADMGPKPHGLTLERKNNDGNYEPENCCWATRKEQASNRLRFGHITICMTSEPNTGRAI